MQILGIERDIALQEKESLKPTNSPTSQSSVTEYFPSQVSSANVTRDMLTPGSTNTVPVSVMLNETNQICEDYIIQDSSQTFLSL